MKSTALLLLSLLVLLAGCSKKKSTQPEPEPDYILQASQTIGSEGDTLTISDFSLIVPQGAFASNATLKLYASSKDKPFGDYGVTRTFRLEGLPTGYYMPLRLCIKYQGPLFHQSFIAIGEEVFARSLCKFRTAYRFFSTADSSGYLVCELPVLQQPEGTSWGNYKNASITQAGNNINAVGVTGQSPYTTPQGHFEITFPVDIVPAASVDSLGRYLEDAFSEFQTMKFSYDRREKFPVKVTVKDLGGDAGGCCNSKWCNNHGYIDVHQDDMPNLQEIRLSAGHEFFHLVQGLYDSRGSWTKATGPGPHYWLDEATAVWSEEKFTDVADYRSNALTRENRMMAPFRGMHAGAQGSNDIAQAHGYGMPGVIKYLVDHYGDTILVRMYEKIYQQKNPAETVISSIPDPLNVWWPRFFREYVGGNIYGLGGDVFTSAQNVTGVFDINTQSDTLRTLAESYPDLSARLYRINLNYTSINSSAQIRFRVSSPNANPDYMKAVVFKLKSNSLQYVDNGAEVTISKVRELTDGDYDLMVVVVNSRHEISFTGSTNISLEIKVQGPPRLSFYKQCKITFGANGLFIDSEGRSTTRDFSMGFEQAGEFSGNTFTALWDYTTPSGNLRDSGSISVTVDSLTYKVISFSANYKRVDNSGGVTYNYSLSGENFPLTKEPIHGWLVGEVSGKEACSYISTIDDKRTWINGDWEVLAGYECETYGSLYIEFRD